MRTTYIRVDMTCQWKIEVDKDKVGICSVRKRETNSVVLWTYPPTRFNVMYNHFIVVLCAFYQKDVI